MINKIQISLAVIFFYVVSSHATELQGDREFALGFSLLDMNYKEFDDTGFLLNREDGILPGIVGQLTFPGQNLDSVIYASYHASVIDYDGHTQSLIPVQTKTDTDIIDVQYRLSEKTSQQNQLYGGFGYRYWSRDIRSTVINTIIGPQGVAGLLEHYKWFYGMLGVKSRFFKDHNSELAFDFRVTQMLKANMDIDFKGFANLDDKTVDLGKKTNFRMSLPWRIKVANAYSWIVEPYYEQWDIGKSNTVSLTSNGSLVILPECGGVCGVLEPRSETRNIGVNIQLVIPF